MLIPKTDSPSRIKEAGHLARLFKVVERFVQGLVLFLPQFLNLMN